jgi:hypothetical protein
MMRWDISNWAMKYLMVGLLAAVAVLIRTELQTKKANKSQFIKTIMAAVREKRSWSETAINAAVGALAFGFLTLVWPTIPFIYLWASREKGRLYAVKEDPEEQFTIKSKHLLRTVNAASVEAQSMVSDPLGRAPQQPFGHLNDAWIALLSKIQDGDQLWYAEVPARWMPGQPNSPKHQFQLPLGEKRGYALVRKGKVIADFVFEWN